jgi:hypothetical protein
MGRYVASCFNTTSTPHYLVAWDLQWHVIDCRRFEPGSDLRADMAATLERLGAEGWQSEGGVEYGFVFIRRGDDRRLLMLTSRDPNDMKPQSFSPFGR